MRLVACGVNDRGSVLRDSLLRATDSRAAVCDELDGERLHSIFELREIHDGSRFSSHLSIHLVELPKFGTAIDRPSRELARWIRLFLARDEEQRQQLAQEDEMAAPVVKILDELSDDPQVRYWMERREEAKQFDRMEKEMIRKQALQEGLEKGLQRGEARGKASAVLDVLRARGIEVPETVRERIESCQELDTLQEWLVRAATVSDAIDIFDD